MATEQRFSFDSIAELYDRARPQYPMELVRRTIEYAGLTEKSRILEVGCGTGQATSLFADVGCRITCVEPGKSMARLAREKLKMYPNVEVLNCTFEDWVAEPAFIDLVLAAQEFHWVPSEIRVAKTAQVLRPGGSLAVIGNVPQEGDADVYGEIQEAYQRHAPHMALAPGKKGIATGLAIVEDDFARSGDYERHGLETFRWTQTYSANSYCELMETHSDHLRLALDVRERLHTDLGVAIQRAGGSIDIDYVTRLFLAKRNR